MGKFTARTFIHDQMSKVPPVLTADLKGKSVMVTGANTGIGLEAVKHFAKMAPARLILACRNEQKGQHAASSEFFSTCDNCARADANAFFSRREGDWLFA